MKPIQHRLQTTFVVGLEHWVVVQRNSAGWVVIEIAEHASHTDSVHGSRRDAEVVAAAIAIVRSFNTLTAEDHR
jgi:hypothetical protein